MVKKFKKITALTMGLVIMFVPTLDVCAETEMTEQIQEEAFIGILAEEGTGSSLSEDILMPDTDNHLEDKSNDIESYESETSEDKSLEIKPTEKLGDSPDINDIKESIEASDVKGFTYCNPRKNDDGSVTYDCVWFGNYWQDDTDGNGTADTNDDKTPIKWRVLSVSDDDLFLLADKILDARAYNTTFDYITWEKSTVRSWLNGYGADMNTCMTDYLGENFIDRAFNQQEQTAIKNSFVDNSRAQNNSSWWYGRGGNDTYDKLFLLSYKNSITEAYGFSTDLYTYDEVRKAYPTEFAKANGAYTCIIEEYIGTVWWWLRSPGEIADHAAEVQCYGDVDYKYVADTSNGVRPALHISPASSLLSPAGTVCSDGTEDEYASSTVFFNSNGGSEVPSAIISLGEAVNKPANPSKQGYHFGGWYTDKELTQIYNFDTPVTSGFTLYAKWIKVNVNKIDISNATITLGTALTYNGSEQTQTVSRVTVNGKDLETADYVVTNNKGIEAGSYILTVTANEDSDYKGSVSIPFIIEKKATLPTVTILGNYTYTGNAIEPEFTVTDGNTSLADSDYTASLSDNTNAGTGKITISATEGGNYSFSPVTQNFTISKAAAKTLTDIRVEQTYIRTSVSGSVAGKMPADAGTLTFTIGTATITKVSGSTISVSDFAVDDKGNVSATISNGTAGDVITLPVTINSTNYEDSTVNVVVTLFSKSDADVSITANSPIKKTYGDDGFTLNADAGNKGTGTGVWTWESSNTAVATVSNAGAVTITGAGESVIKAHYESDTTVGEAAIILDVNAKALYITWSNTSFNYDGAAHKPTATLTGVINGDDCTVSVSGEQTEEGTYTATAALNGTASVNYILPGNLNTCSFTISKIKVSNIEITGTSDPVSMQKGDKKQLGVTITPANATDKTVKWSSSKPDVVTVDDTGLIMAIEDGEAEITAEANDGSGVKATLTVKVASVMVTGIELRVTGGTVMIQGSSRQIEAVITPSYATDKNLTWTSSDINVATVDDNGLVTVKDDSDSVDGTVFTVTASSKDGVSASISFTVKKNENPVTSIKIDPRSVKTDAKPDDTFRLTAIIDPANATDKTVTWESSDTGTAEISPTGVVNVKNFGKTTITARSGNGISGTYELNIEKIKVTGITMNTSGGDDYLAIGKSTQLSAVITPANASVKDIVWMSSDTKLADVDANGVVTGKAQGKVTITASAKDDNTKKASISLTVFDDSDTLYVEFAEGSDYTYTGKPIMPIINVYNRGKLLMQETDYTVKFSNNVNANDAAIAKKAPKAVVTGKTIATTTEAIFRILPKDIGDETSVSAEEINVTYGKSASPLLYYGGIKLGTKDLTNPYAKDKFTESRAITIYGTGNFTGEREVWINVMDAKEVKSIPKIKVQSFNPVPKVYSGQPQYISKDEIVVVSASDKKKTPLVMDKDFFIVYPDDVTNAGTVKITVIGKGNYVGSAGKSYNIESAKNGETIKKVNITFPDAEGKTGTYDSFEYKPGGVFPAVEILATHNKGNTETLAAGRDYKVSYKDNTKAGAANKNKPATATITFLGNYKNLGKMTKNFYIDQADLGKAKTYAMDKVVNKDQPKYPISEPIADIDGTTVNKKEYMVTYRVNDGKKDIEVTSKDKLFKALEPGESVAVTVEIKAKTDKNGTLTGNYKGTAPVCRYNITRTDADHDLSKATVIIQNKGDKNHKAVTQFGFTGKPIKIGSVEYSGYELYVYVGKKSAPIVLTEGTDFSVDYSNNVNAGKATVMINGCARGNYYGSKIFNFKIDKGRMLWAR